MRQRLSRPRAFTRSALLEKWAVYQAPSRREKAAGPWARTPFISSCRRAATLFRVRAVRLRYSQRAPPVSSAARSSANGAALPSLAASRAIPALRMGSRDRAKRTESSAEAGASRRYAVSWAGFLRSRERSCWIVQVVFMGMNLTFVYGLWCSFPLEAPVIHSDHILSSENSLSENAAQLFCR